ncbi:hypothetical protein CORC01_00457 [Colletotrichum orchidophilum]|uniref:Uncharacterized protein n=1 Tax=Colletotrichum orchidophilum TaxID=1209926 RepID=A0A1G4BRU3_9PEZI|nr:uncharacterized protein CORC01_00457 [Colletotrichum orchidophilum]OHF04118.1 hypothetical protein CORC01_00457 [Colletotrichum orchidophilum]
MGALILTPTALALNHLNPISTPAAGETTQFLRAAGRIPVAHSVNTYLLMNGAENRNPLVLGEMLTLESLERPAELSLKPGLSFKLDITAARHREKRVAFAMPKVMQNAVAAAEMQSRSAGDRPYAPLPSSQRRSSVAVAKDVAASLYRAADVVSLSA